LLTNAYGEQYPSQPNYFWLFSGSNQGITYDSPYWSHTNPKHAVGLIFDTLNLYTTLEQKFTSSSPVPVDFFGDYVDSGTDKPISAYYEVKNKVVTNNYANRRVPWLGFSNINNGDPAGIAHDFATAFSLGKKANYSKLPKASFVIPALHHDMHDYDSFGHSVQTPADSSAAIRDGDLWLEQNLGRYAEWAKTHNSLLIITFDEDSTADWPTPISQQGGDIHGSTTNPYGLTAPNLNYKPTKWAHPPPKGKTGPNHIAMVFYGAGLAKHGLYSVPGTGVNNVNLLRTIESFFGLRKSGKQTPLAVKAGMNDEGIEGVFGKKLAR